MNPTVLDTDILNEVLKRRNRVVATHTSAYLKAHSQLAFSLMTRFEVVRSIRYRKSSRLMRDFHVVESQSLIISVSDEILDRAADLWAEARSNGKPHRDADLIIAATALVHGRTLVTGNTPHFDWIPGLAIATWREP